MVRLFPSHFEGSRATCAGWLRRAAAGVGSRMHQRALPQASALLARGGWQAGCGSSAVTAEGASGTSYAFAPGRDLAGDVHATQQTQAGSLLGMLLHLSQKTLISCIWFTKTQCCDPGDEGSAGSGDSSNKQSNGSSVMIIAGSEQEGECELVFPYAHPQDEGREICRP